MVYNCASMMDNGQRVSHLSSMAKYYASDVLNEVVRGCLQLHGGYGYSKEFVIEKLYRDAKLTEYLRARAKFRRRSLPNGWALSDGGSENEYYCFYKADP